MLSLVLNNICLVSPMLRGVSYTQYAFDAFETLHCIESESSAAKSHQKKSRHFERNPRRTCSVSPPLMLLTAATVSLGNFSKAGFADNSSVKVSLFYDCCLVQATFMAFENAAVAELILANSLTFCHKCCPFSCSRLSHQKCDLGNKPLPLAPCHIHDRLKCKS